MAGYVFPLITYPYVSRVLGVTNIGKCNFIDNIIQCFVLISMLGIATVGIREIAKNKEDKVALSKVFTGLFIINSFTTLLALCFLFISIHSIEKFAGYKELLFIGSFKLFGTYLMIDWFYKGIEEFRFITVRTLIIRILYVISVFLFVKNENDYDIYYCEGGNLAASKIRNLECPSYEICLIDYGCGKFNRKIHIMEQYP